MLTDPQDLIPRKDLGTYYSDWISGLSMTLQWSSWLIQRPYKSLRHVYDFKAPGLDSQTFTEEVLAIIDRYGDPEMVVADFGGGGARMLLETINQRYGLAIQPAERSLRTTISRLINGDFLAGRIQLIPGSDLDHELCGLQWDLSNDAKTISGSSRSSP